MAYRTFAAAKKEARAQANLFRRSYYAYRTNDGESHVAAIFPAVPTNKVYAVHPEPLTSENVQRAGAYVYRGHVVTPIDGETTYGQSKVRITGPIVNTNKAAENARLEIDGRVNRAEREAVRAGEPPVISEESRCAALIEWAKHRCSDAALAAAYRALDRK